MSTIPAIPNAQVSAGVHSAASENVPENVSDRPIATVHPTLSEVQIRAYRIHQQHGGTSGGYDLDDWLEAEHELDDEWHKNGNGAGHGVAGAALIH